MELSLTVIGLKGEDYPIDWEQCLEGVTLRMKVPKDCAESVDYKKNKVNIIVKERGDSLS